MGYCSGGPNTAAEAAKKFGIPDGKAKTFEVRHLTVKQPACLRATSSLTSARQMPGSYWGRSAPFRGPAAEDRAEI